MLRMHELPGGDTIVLGLSYQVSLVLHLDVTELGDCPPLAAKKGVPNAPFGPRNRPWVLYICPRQRTTLLPC